MVCASNECAGNGDGCVHAVLAPNQAGYCGIGINDENDGTAVGGAATADVVETTAALLLLLPLPLLLFRLVVGVPWCFDLLVDACCGGGGGCCCCCCNAVDNCD